MAYSPINLKTWAKQTRKDRKGLRYYYSIQELADVLGISNFKLSRRIVLEGLKLDTLADVIELVLKESPFIKMRFSKDLLTELGESEIDREAMLERRIKRGIDDVTE